MVGDVAGQLSWALGIIGVLGKIFVIDLLLSADNVLLIALAVRRLPGEQVRTATIAGMERSA